MSKEFETIILKKENRIANIILNRPDALNALNDKITFELKEAFELCNSDKDVRVVVLSAKGKGFSSGGDIKLMTKLESDPNVLNKLLENLHSLIIDIRNLDKPVIASINGFAFGAGLSLALACDFRIAAKNSTYSCAFVNIALIPDSGASFFLTKLVGYAKALELMMLGDTINSDQALEIGLVTRVVSDDELKVVTEKFAQQVLSKPHESLTRIKRMVNKAIIADLSDQLSLEAHFQKEVSQKPDFKEAIMAFVEKRKPKFE